MKSLFGSSISQTVHLITAAGLLAALTAGCGRSPDDAVQEDVDLAQAVDLFDDVGAPAEQPARDLDRVIARVNGTEITEADLMTEFNILAGRMQGRVPPERLAQMQEEILQGAMDNLIIKQLLLDEVDKEAVEVSEQEIDETIARYRQQIPPELSLEDQLTQIGMSKDEFRENIARDVRVNKLLEAKVGDPVDPTEEEIARFHEQHRDEYFAMPERVSASHILLSVEPGDGPDAQEEALEKAESLRQELLDGADFAEIAQAHSDCPSSMQGGDLGTFVRGQMVPPFEQAAFSQAIGEIGEIVKTDFGYHIIQVHERHEEGTASLDESRDQIAQFLISQSREEALRAYVTELREAADIEMMDAPAAPETAPMMP